MAIKNVFGPYLRSVETDAKWHWIKRCSHYPNSLKCQAMLSSIKPAMESLCKECIKLENFDIPDVNVNKFIKISKTRF